MRVNFERLDQLVAEGLLRKFVSNDGKLVGYNYTDKCTYERKWNRDTKSARGTVYEVATGRIVARAFDKFFNFSELPKSKSRHLAKKKNFETFEKMDGSLGIIYNYNHAWMVNTRGSFDSDQARMGYKMLLNQAMQHHGQYTHPDLPHYTVYNMNEEYTYLVEIIYPDNKIIVNYGQDHKLVLLAMIHTESGDELPYDMMVEHAKEIGMPVAKKYEFESIDDLIQKQSEMGWEEEGYVVKIGDERVKFKSLEYLKVASAMAHMTPIHFWKNMKNGSFDPEFLAKFPEELNDDVKEITLQLKKNYAELKREIEVEYNNLYKGLCPVMRQVPKSVCKHVGQNLNKFKHPNALFALINGNKDQADEYVRKRIRPTRNEL